jgi:hypothetical protein
LGGLRPDAPGESDGAKRRLAGWLQDNGASGGKAGRHFPHRQNERKIPWTDRSDDPNGGLEHEMSLAFNLGGNDSTITAARFLSEPSQVINRHGDFSGALRERFSILQGDRVGNFISAPFEFAGDFLQKFPPRFARQLAPDNECRLGIEQSVSDTSRGHNGHPSEALSRRRVGDRDGVFRHHPFVIQVNWIRFHAVLDFVEISHSQRNFDKVFRQSVSTKIEDKVGNESFAIDSR